MELYHLNRGDKFLLNESEPQIPVDSNTPDIQTVYKLHNIDGMYSYCTDDKGNVYHFAAWTDVETV